MFAWHLPPLYNLAMADHRVHIVQHLCFLAASVLMWWPLVSRVPELPALSRPLQMLYVCLLMIPMSIIGMIITERIPSHFLHIDVLACMLGEKLAAVCVERGYSRLEWSVLDWNTPSIDFYKAAGATPMDGWTVFRLTDAALTEFAAAR